MRPSCRPPSRGAQLTSSNACSPAVPPRSPTCRRKVPSPPVVLLLLLTPPPPSTSSPSSSVASPLATVTLQLHSATPTSLPTSSTAPETTAGDLFPPHPSQISPSSPLLPSSTEVSRNRKACSRRIQQNGGRHKETLLSARAASAS